MICGTAAVGEIVLKNTEQTATAPGGVERCSRGRDSSISVMAWDHKNMEIPIRHSNKLFTNTAVLLYMSGCAWWVGAVFTSVVLL